MTDTNQDESLSTEAQILDNIGEGLPGEQAAGQDTTESTETSTSDQVSNDQEASGQSGDTSTGTQQGTQQTPGPQDLVDRNGNVIARGGPERRHYETAQRLKQENTALTNRVTQLEASAQAVNDAGNLGTQFSLTPEELTTGAQMIAAFKENPVDTVKYLLTQAQAAGHNIDGIGGTTDTAAMKQMMETMLSPLLGDRQAQLDTQEYERQALETYNTFIGTYPDASVHEDSLARLVSQQGLAPDAAYFKLKAFYAEKGLDWNVPLETHAANARKAQEAAKNNGSGANQTQLPTGGTSEANVTDTPIVADTDTSYDDIIRESMREAGASSN